MTRTHEPAPRARWWSDRWAWRAAIAAAPAGALVAIVHALLVLRASVSEALVAYVVGAMLASGIACVLAGPLGGAVTAARLRRRRTTATAFADADVYPDEDRAAGDVGSDAVPTDDRRHPSAGPGTARGHRLDPADGAAEPSRRPAAV
jgi:hypothetical protein